MKADTLCYTVTGHTLTHSQPCVSCYIVTMLQHQSILCMYEHTSTVGGSVCSEILISPFLGGGIQHTAHCSMVSIQRFLYGIRLRRGRRNGQSGAEPGRKGKKRGERERGERGENNPWPLLKDEPCREADDR
ncbi:hypothetical protein FKM82_027067 [Ascaphus truei]